jgi:hypothetical protein
MTALASRAVWADTPFEAIDDEPDNESPTATAAQSVPVTGTVEPPVQTADALVDAVAIDCVVPVSGNLGVCGQQFC